jgi:fructose-1,6-bisphosphatase II
LPLAGYDKVAAILLLRQLEGLLRILGNPEMDVILMSAEPNSANSNQTPGADRSANQTDPDRNLALELVRATEAAAIACSRYMGFGDKEQVDRAAVDAMRPVLGSVRMNGVVVIGEGEKDEAPMLFNGEHVGDGTGPDLDIAVDPVDGTTLTAKSLPDAVSVLGVSPRGTMFDPGPAVYMQKLVVPAAVAEQVDLDAPIGDTLQKIARHADRRVSDLTAAVLDRPRHEALVKEIRAAGARIRFLADGDVAGAIMAAAPETGVDLLVGTGGTPEGVLAACALRCLGGEMLGRLIARNDSERQAALEGGYDLQRILTTSDLVSSDNVFFAATGVTDGALLEGVRFRSHQVITHSLSMRSRSRTIRLIEGRHDPDRSLLINY